MPTQRLQLSYERGYSTSVNSALGNAILGVTVTATALGGFYAHPFLTPLDMDRSRVARLFFPIWNPGGAGPAAGNVQLDTSHTNCLDTSTANNVNVTNIVAITAAWTGGRCRYIELLNAGGPYFAGGYFQPRQLHGIRFARNGPAVADTWAATLGLTTCPWIEYSENCLKSCL
jgi:hypothetical protein